MPSDPIRDALGALVNATESEAMRGSYDHGACSEAYRRGRIEAATEALQAYDSAKFALDDTADAATVEIKRPRTPRRKK